MGGGSIKLDGNAQSDDVLNGKTFYNDNPRHKQTGSLVLTGNAASDDVISGKTFYNTNPKSKVSGTLALTGNASAGDVLSGSTFYNTNPKTKVTGTLELSGNATAGDVIAEKTFYNTNAKTKVTGTLELTGTATASNVATGYTFYNTNPKTIVTGTLSLSGNVAPSEVLYGRTFYNDSLTDKRTGTMVNRGTWGSTDLAAGASVTIPQGYHSGSGVVTAAPLPTLSGNATAAQVLSGYTFYNTSYTKVTGTYVPEVNPFPGYTYQTGSLVSVPATGNGTTSKTMAIPAGCIPICIYCAGEWRFNTGKGETSNIGFRIYDNTGTTLLTMNITRSATWMGNRNSSNSIEPFYINPFGAHGNNISSGASITTIYVQTWCNGGIYDSIIGSMEVTAWLRKN